MNEEKQPMTELRRHFSLSGHQPTTNLSPEQVKNLRAAYLDKDHPDHAKAVKTVTTEIYDRLFPAPAAPQLAAADPRIEALKRSEAYLNADHLEHKRTVQAVSADHDRRAAGRAPAQSSEGGRVEDAKRSPAYLDRDDPGHKEAVRVVNEHYEREFPEKPAV
jgi:hypothetical protein